MPVISYKGETNLLQHGQHDIPLKALGCNYMTGIEMLFMPHCSLNLPPDYLRRKCSGFV